MYASVPSCTIEKKRTSFFRAVSEKVYQTKMSKMKLRTKIPINYYEPEEPSFDKYICECILCRNSK